MIRWRLMEPSAFVPRHVLLWISHQSREHTRVLVLLPNIAEGVELRQEVSTEWTAAELNTKRSLLILKTEVQPDLKYDQYNKVPYHQNSLHQWFPPTI